MKKTLTRLLALLLALTLLLSFAACGGEEEENTPTPQQADPRALFHALLEQVTYASPMTDMGENAIFSFRDLPEYAMVTMYCGSGYYADEVVWITLAKESDMEAARKSVDLHIEQLHEQFLSYLPDELPKIENAQIWTQGTDMILCITNDYQNAKAIMDNPSLIQSGVEETTVDTTEAPTEEDVTEPPTEPVETTEPPTEEPTKSQPAGLSSQWADGTLNAQGYPKLISQDQGSRDCGAACIVDNMAFEYYNYYGAAAEYYAKLVNRTAELLDGQTTVYTLVIPTAIGVVFPDNLVEKYSNSYERQGERIQQIYSLMDSRVVGVDCFDNMMQHRDEYLYFRTDWHWNGIGAYYAYESFCEAKGVQPYTMAQRKLSKFEGYLGPLYTISCDYDYALAGTPDTVCAYHPYSENVEMYYTDAYGNRYNWPVIANGDDYGSDFKYGVFAASDQPFAEFYNADVTDGSVAIVVKESFGNAFMPYIVDHYSTVYEIDYRHWSGDLVAFAQEKGATDIIFVNNIGMVRSDRLVAMMDRIIP